MPGEPMSAKAWIYAKRALASAKLESHREEEGAMFLDRLPTNQGPEAIRSYCGIPSATRSASRQSPI